MRVLLDECIPRKLKQAFPEHDCQTVPEAGLAGKQNGVLLGLAESLGFDLFLTMDKGVPYQQNLSSRILAIVVIRAKSNRLADLLPHVEGCRGIMRTIQPGQVRRIGERI